MTRDYSKLETNIQLKAFLQSHYNNSDINVMVGKNLDTILLGNGMMFIVENDIVSYYSGLSKMTATDIMQLSKLIAKIQSIVVLECSIK